MSGFSILACVSPGRNGGRDVLRMEDRELTQKLTCRLGVVPTFNLNTQKGKKPCRVDKVLLEAPSSSGLCVRSLCSMLCHCVPPSPP